MELATPYPEQNHVCGELEQRISSDTHEGEYTQRKQRHSHHHNLRGGWQVHPHQFRIAYKQKQENCLNCIAGLQQAAQQLTRICVVGWNCIDIAELSVIHWRLPPLLQAPPVKDRPPNQYHFDDGTVLHSRAN